MPQGRKSLRTAVFLLLGFGALAAAWLVWRASSPDAGPRTRTPDTVREGSHEDPLPADPALVGSGSTTIEAGPPDPPRSEFTVVVTGRVVDTQGEPVSGGQVEALALPSGIRYRPATVGPDGTFEGVVHASREKRIWLFYASPEATSTGAKVELSASRPRVELEFVAQAMLHVTVIVSDAAGHPVAGAEVEARGSPRPIQGVTDQEGRWVVTVPCGTAGFWARTADGARGTSPRGLPQQPGATIEHRIVLGTPWEEVPLRLVPTSDFPASRVVGRVVLSLRGRKTVLPSVEVGGSAESVEVPLDDDVYGVVSIEGMGDYRFRWRSPDGRPSGISVTIFPRGSVTLQLADELGSPLPGLRLWFRRRESAGDVPASDIPTGGKTWTDSQGRSDLVEIAYGTYDIYLSREPDALSIGSFVVDAASAGTKVEVVASGLSTLGGTWSLPSFLDAATLPLVRVYGGRTVVEVGCREDGTWAVTLPFAPGVPVEPALRHDGQPLGPRRRAHSGDTEVALDYADIGRLTIQLEARGPAEDLAGLLRLMGTDEGDTYGVLVSVSEEGVATLFGVPEGPYAVAYSRDSFVDDIQELGEVSVSAGVERLELRIP